MICDQLRLHPRGWSHNRSDRNIEMVLLLLLVRPKMPQRDPPQHHDFKFIKATASNEAQSGKAVDADRYCQDCGALRQNPTLRNTVRELDTKP